MNKDSQTLKEVVANSMVKEFVEDYSSVKNRLDRTNSLIKIFISHHNETFNESVEINEIAYNEYCIESEKGIDKVLTNKFGDKTSRDFENEIIERIPEKSFDDLMEKTINELSPENTNAVALGEEDSLILYNKALNIVIPKILKDEYENIFKDISNHILKYVISNKIPDIYKKDKKYYDSIFDIGFKMSREMKFPEDFKTPKK